jgi:hypothetical protein
MMSSPFRALVNILLEKTMRERKRRVSVWLNSCDEMNEEGEGFGKPREGMRGVM